VVPAQTAYAVLCSVLSQLFMLIGFLLPLKVVLLLGSDTIPGYFPDFFQRFGREGLVLGLSAASVVFYLMHLGLAKAVDITASSASQKLMHRSKKMAIFENQDEIALKGYQRYSQSLAAVSFVVLCLGVMAVIYPKLAGVIIGYIICCVVLSASFSEVSESFSKSLFSDLGTVVRILGSIGFLVIFAFIVLDHLFGNPPGIIVSVISLLLGRQLFGRLANLFKDMQGLFSQRPQLAALFFHGHIFMQRPKDQQKGIWELVDPGYRNQWIVALLEDSVGDHVELGSVEWLEMGVPDILCFRASFECDDEKFSYLIKVFNKNRSAWARHEAEIITASQWIPALKSVSITVVDGFHCHVFDVTGLSRCGKAEVSRNLQTFRLRLAQWLPSEELVSLYLRSHPQVWQEIDGVLFQRMADVLVDKADKHLIDRLCACIPAIKETLRKLPLSVCIVDLRPAFFWKNEEGKFFLSHWAGWTLEPVGAKWPIQESAVDQVERLVEEVANKRSDVSSISHHDVRLALIFSEFQIRLKRGRFQEAYALLESLLQECERE
jgi:hypothetical protein